MYNGIGLTTPRGSGTNGYVTRNLSVLRNFQSADERKASWEVAPPKHREPDQGILDHEKKRTVEVKCLELQVKLEDDGVDEDEIEQRVDALRQKLLSELSRAAPVNPRTLKSSDTHALAAAKSAELSRMARALGTNSNYVEGDAFDREKQEDLKKRRAVEREERDQQRAADRAKFLEQKEKWAAEHKERERSRRQDEDRARRERAPPSDAMKGPKGRRMSPPPRPNRARSISPARRRRRSRSRSSSISRSRSPLSDSRSRSPPPNRRRRSLSAASPPRDRERSRSPRRRSPPRRELRRRSPSPLSRSRSPEPRKRALQSPAPQRRGSRSRSRSSSNMSVSDRSRSP